MDFVRACCFLIAIPAFSAGPDLREQLRAIENRYNRAQSLTLSFSENYAASRRPARTESGILYLRKPGRMRWEYADPAGKLFVSDGKNVFLYTPGDSHAEKSKLKETDDMRAPLAFLLGKLDFDKEFKSFTTTESADGTWIAAEPKSPNLAYTKVEFLAAPTGEIHRVRVTGQDMSRLEFSFTNEKLNAPVTPSLFAFQPPPGIPVVEADR
jgi:outer membrane lipoprotein carrier protein